MGMSKIAIEKETNEMLANLKAQGIKRTIEQMAGEIKQAVKNGLSMATIDKGAKYCGKICKDESVSAYHVIRIYSNLVNTRKKKQPSESLESHNTITNNVTKHVTNDIAKEETTTNMQSEIDTLKEQVKALHIEINRIKETNAPITNNVTNATKQVNEVFAPAKEKKIVLGFILKFESSTVKGCVYQNWFAKKTISGKLHRIYIGKTINKAEDKIKAYCNAKGVSLG